MTRDDARAFLYVINSIAPFVPPMFYAQITGSPVARMIERMANEPETSMPPTEQMNPERPKPHAVS